MSRAGGPRVTVEMANRLLLRGYDIRIAAGKLPKSPKKTIMNTYLFILGREYRHWGYYFKRRIHYFRDLKELSFYNKEIIIGVGTRAVQMIRKLDSNVIKVRYCHGFDSSNEKLTEEVWSGSMSTISVAASLIPQLERYSNKKVMAVIPNGVRRDEYYLEECKRDGIGMVYGAHPNKSPEEALTLVKLIKGRWPEIPLYIFGANRRPKIIHKNDYWFHPSISQARRLYNRAKVWLVPSRMEGFGLPLLEAMACGAACISTDNVGCTEVVKHGVNGILVPIGQPHCFLEYIDLLMRNEKRREKIVTEGYKTVKHFSWDNAVDAMEKFLKTLYENSTEVK